LRLIVLRAAFDTGESMFATLRGLSRSTSLILLVLFLPAFLFGATPTVERTGAVSAPGVPDDLKKAIEDKGYRVTLDDGWTAEFWFARALPSASKESPGALYPWFANGEFVAVANFPKGASDYRGQALPPGLYALRYQYLPQDANHMGVSPNPDFVLAVPAGADANPGDNLPLKRLVALSEKSTGTSHPAVFALAAAGTRTDVAKDDQGMIVLTVEVPTATSGKAEKLGIVIKGQATQ
jgi:hypothetical protein